jgi:hypothetical protein
VSERVSHREREREERERERERISLHVSMWVVMHEASSGIYYARLRTVSTCIALQKHGNLSQVA